MKRACYILEEEGVSYDQRTVVDLIMRHAPDWRRVLNELQRSSLTGPIAATQGSVSGSVTELFKHLKSKDFKKMRTWVSQNVDADATSIFRSVYDGMSQYIKPESIPQLVLILADYQYKNAFVADHELNTVAFMTEIMANVEFV